MFEENYNVRIRDDKPDAPIEFNNCVFNSSLNFDNIHARIPVEIDRCLFNENSCLNMKNFNDTAEFGLYHLEIRNTIFKGTVNFDGGVIPTKSILEYLTFFREISFKDTKIEKDVKIQNLSFAPFITKLAKDGFKSFLNALNVNGYGKEAKFYEQNVGAEAVEQKIDKDKLEIAIKSNWVSIKQAAAILGISYTTLLAMRKEDKAGGIQRIPYRGEGKRSCYYVPLLEAYKSRDMALVNKLAKEMEGK